MNVGSIVFATEQGLGYLAKQFHDAGVVTDPVVLAHGRRPTRRDWYPDAPLVNSLSDRAQRLQLWDHLANMDAVLFFETPFDWSIIPFLKQHRVKTVLMVMHECMPERLPEQPDLLLCPSLLDKKAYPNGLYLPVPAAADLPWAARTRPVRTFVHNAGHGGLLGRNGTRELVDALKLVRSRIRLILRHQDRELLPFRLDVPRHIELEWTYDTVPRERLYADGDCFVFPEKFNGLSLPLQEAFAAGMVVAATARYPNTSYLPAGPLIPIAGLRHSRVAARCRQFEEAVVLPEDVAAVIDRLYDSDPTALSLEGKRWAEANSWQVLKPHYLEALS